MPGTNSALPVWAPALNSGLKPWDGICLWDGIPTTCLWCWPGPLHPHLGPWSQPAELKSASCLLLPYLTSCQPPPGCLPASSGQAGGALCWSWHAHPGLPSLKAPDPSATTLNATFSCEVATLPDTRHSHAGLPNGLTSTTPASHSWTAPTCPKPLPRKGPLWKSCNTCHYWFWPRRREECERDRHRQKRRKMQRQKTLETLRS